MAWLQAVYDWGIRHHDQLAAAFGLFLAGLLAIAAFDLLSLTVRDVRRWWRGRRVVAAWGRLGAQAGFTDELHARLARAPKAYGTEEAFDPVIDFGRGCWVPLSQVLATLDPEVLRGEG